MYKNVFSKVTTKMFLFYCIFFTVISNNNICQASITDYFPIRPDGYKLEVNTYSVMEFHNIPNTTGIEQQRYIWVDGTKTVSNTTCLKYHHSFEDFYSSNYSRNCITKINHLTVDMEIEVSTSNGLEKTTYHLNPYETLMETNLNIGESYSFSFSLTASPSPSPDYVQNINKTITIIGIENINTHYGCFQDTLKYQVTGTVQTTYNSTIQTKSLDTTTWVLPGGLEVRRVMKVDGVTFTDDDFSDGMASSLCENQTVINSVFLLLLNNQ